MSNGSVSLASFRRKAPCKDVLGGHIDKFSTGSSGCCAAERHGVTFRSGSGHGRRSMGASGAGGTMGRSHVCSGPCSCNLTRRAYWIGTSGTWTRLRLERIGRQPGPRKKKAQGEPDDHALGRSRGGFGSKIHFVCDSRGIPLAAVLSGAQASDASYFEHVMQCVAVPTPTGRPRSRPSIVVADKGYDSQAIRRYCGRRRIKSVIPVRALPEGKKRRMKGPRPKLDREAYRSRNIIERMIGWLKNCRRLAFRFDKLALSFAAMISVAMIRHYVVKCL